MTQRLPRSSRTPGLRLPSANREPPARTASATASATRAGWEKKAVHPPQPRMARPREAAVPPRTSVTLTMVMLLVKLPQRRGVYRQASSGRSDLPDNVCTMPPAQGRRLFPALWSPGDDGIEHCAHPGDIGRIIHIDRTLCRIEHAVERLTHTRDARGASPGAIAAADLPLLRELARDGLPVEV